ncbi:hypothetical protein CLU79DRAFT_767518 [Phycomyces nitens]|nr:hypothetical protein CLU79DRAFT_767518 [Phycomyces nitens]
MISSSSKPSNFLAIALFLSLLVTVASAVNCTDAFCVSPASGARIDPKCPDACPDNCYYIVNPCCISQRAPHCNVTASASISAFLNSSSVPISLLPSVPLSSAGPNAAASSIGASGSQATVLSIGAQNTFSTYLYTMSAVLIIAIIVF